MRRMILTVVVVLLAGAVSAGAQQAIVNADVVKMVKAGLGTELIVATIRNAPAKNFDTSPDALVQLKTDGVPDAVIAAMLGASPALANADPNDPRAPHEAGVYLDAGEGSSPRLVRLGETTSTGMRVGGAWKSIITGPFTKMSMKYRVRDPQAELRTTNVRPVFYVYGQDPRDLVLLKLERKGKEREFTSMQMGGMTTGTTGPKEYTGFTTERIADGIHRLGFAEPLEPGEYGFGVNTYAGMVMSVYDFGIDAPKTAAREE